MSRIVHTLCLVAAAPVVTGAAAPLAPAEDGSPGAVVCPSGDESTLAAAGCPGVDPVPDLDPADTPEALARAAAASAAAAALPHQCRYHSEVVFYTSSDWIRLTRLLAADTSYCADLSISVPPLVADKRNPRPNEPARIKAFGDVFHPMGEIHYATWSKYVGTPQTPTFYDAGFKAGADFAAAGYDLWALNEVPSSVRQGQPDARANLAQFVNGLHDGSDVPGLVFVIGLGQRTSPLDVYRGNLENWLYDSLFWSTIGDSVRFWAQEVYGDVRAWAVPGASRNERARHLADYLLHGASLAEGVGDGADAARAVLERTFVPLANAAWRYTSGFGNTDVEAPLMQSYVSEQVFAVRHYAGANPGLAPGGRSGWAYAPKAPVDVAGTEAILTRLASALHEAYEEGGGSQAGACGPAGEHVWCEGELAGAAFVEGWGGF